MAKYKVSEHREEIITHIIKNLIWIPIAAVIPLVWKVAQIIFSKLPNISEGIWSIILSCISVAISIFTVIYVVYISKKREKKRQQNQIVSNFRFSSVTAELVFNTRTEITSTIDYKMIILADSVSELPRDVIWTGSKYNGTKLIQANGDYELVEGGRSRSPYPYTINFNDEKKRGELVEFKTETSVEDGNLDMTPIYSFMVKYQIDELKLCVIAPKNMLKNVKKAVYADRARALLVNEPVAIRGETVGNLKKFVFEIKNPSLLYNYFIEWEFTN